MDELTTKAYYIYKLIVLINFDYEKYYSILFKNALKYGMTKQQFWYEDYNDYFIYEEAYQERLHEEKHIQGYYNCIAFNTVLSNAFADKKKGDRPQSYPEFNLYVQYKEKTEEKATATKNVVVTKENLNQVFLNRLLNCY